MTTTIKQLQKEIMDMGETLKELAVLEDYNGADYSEVLDELKWNHQMLKHRLLSLQLRGEKK